MDLGLKGKRALVSASSAGLGLGVARALAEAGCEVAMNGRDVDRLAGAVAGVPGAVAVAGSVGSPLEAIDVARRAVDAIGEIDILVTNAGGPAPGTFAETPLEAYPPAMELTLTSAVALCQQCVPPMRANRWGRVVAITSVAVRQPIGNLILSNTMRSGLTGFLKTLALEIASDGVTVNSIQPGFHDTARLRTVSGDDMSELAGRVPARRLGDADDFGRVAAFLCSQSASFITGTALPVDGGAYLGLL